MREAFELKQPVFVFELDADGLQALLSDTKYRLRIPRFPALVRDITLILDQDREAREVLRRRRGHAGGPARERSAVRRVFGGPDPGGQKQPVVPVHLSFPGENAGDDEDIHDQHQSLTERLMAAFHATLPG